MGKTRKTSGYTRVGEDFFPSRSARRISIKWIVSSITAAIVIFASIYGFLVSCTVLHPIVIASIGALGAALAVTLVISAFHLCVPKGRELVWAETYPFVLSEKREDALEQCIAERKEQTQVRSACGESESAVSCDATSSKGQKSRRNIMDQLDRITERKKLVSACGDGGAAEKSRAIVTLGNAVRGGTRVRSDLEKNDKSVGYTLPGFGPLARHHSMAQRHILEEPGLGLGVRLPNDDVGVWCTFRRQDIGRAGTTARSAMLPCVASSELPVMRGDVERVKDIGRQDSRRRLSAVWRNTRPSDDTNHQSGAIASPYYQWSVAIFALICLPVWLYVISGQDEEERGAVGKIVALCALVKFLDVFQFIADDVANGFFSSTPATLLNVTEVSNSPITYLPDSDKFKSSRS